MEDYVYDALDEEASEVRILLLLPGERDDPIQALLFTTVLTREDYPDYEALSYVWGSQEDPVSIAIRTATTRDIYRLFGSNNGFKQRSFEGKGSEQSAEWTLSSRSWAQHFGRVSVTQNLACALPYLRLKSKVRALWIDALCVNQLDLEERSKQVQRMAHIYRRALRVVIWLGEASPDSDVAIRILEEIESKWGDMYTPVKLDVATLRSLSAFCNRPWFYRLWILQEIHFASRDSVLLCGTSSLQWQKARIAFRTLCSKGIFDESVSTDPARSSIMDRYHERIVHISHLCRHSILDRREDGWETHFLDLVCWARGAQCSDPRDRVFALLSLVSSRQLSIKPDYTKSQEYVFKQAVKNLMDLSYHHHFLFLCTLPLSGTTRPSWVPDFTKLCVPGSYSTGQPCGSYSHKIKIDKNILFTIGKQISTITSIHEDHRNSANSPEDINTLLWKLVSETKANEDVERLRELLTTVVAGRFAERYHPPKIGRFPVSIVDRQIDCVREEGPAGALFLPLQGDKHHWLYLNYASLYFKTGSILVDELGHFGLCPASSRPGDVVVMLLGSGAPLILRPQPDNTYLVVGEAYHHFSMHREPFLGPLPHPFRPVINRAGFLVYLNQETGKTQSDDPRLGDPPEGWCRDNNHEQKENYQVFVETATGKRFASNVYDPRTTPEELRKREVDLKEFKLA